MHVRRILGRAVGALLLVVGLLVAAASPAHALGSITVDNATVTEGTGGTKTMSFVVHLSVPNLTPVTLDYTTQDDTAVGTTETEPGDFTPTSGQLVIPVGATQATIPVTITTDAFPEPNETLRLTLSNPGPVGTTIGDGEAVGTITNDDGPVPALRVNDATASEAAGSLGFTVSLDRPAPQKTSVTYTAVGVTATVGDDFAVATGTAVIPAGATSTPVLVGIVSDQIDEADQEQLTLQLTKPLNATIVDPSGLGTITDDDDAPTLTVDAPTVGETDGTTALTFTFTLSGPSGRTASVDYATADGTATAGSDYTAKTGTVVFTAGGTAEQVSVTITGDDVDEPDETVVLNLSAATNLTLGQPTATGTIVNDELDPTLSVDDLTVGEGNTGTADASVTVRLSEASGQTVTVKASTAIDSGTADPATAGGDYTAVTNEVVTFAAGETTKTVLVPIVGDALDEANESFLVTLSQPANAGIGDASGKVTISDDDATPTLSIDDVTVAEGDVGSSPAELTVTLSAPSGRNVTVAASTSNGTATGGADFGPQAGTALSVPAGQTTVVLDVDVYGDQLVEADETFSVVLSGPTNATVSDGTGVVTITDDDDQGPAMSINDVSVNEGSSLGDTELTFTVSLSESSAETTTVHYATADGTATAGALEDYAAASGTLTIDAGQTEKALTVLVHRDVSAEPNETLLVELSDPTTAVLADDTGVGTILNDDGTAPSLSVDDPSVAEGDGTATITVTLSAATLQTVTVDVATEADTATSPDDFTEASATVTIPAGQTSGTTDVDIIDDAVDEPDEAFSVLLSNARNATISDDTGVVTITDDDVTPSVLSVGDATAAEGTDATVTVSLSEASVDEITVQLTTADGTATAGDYEATSATVTFAPGDTSEDVLIPTVEDTTDEADETFTVELSNPTGGATLGADATGVVTITDDDAAPTVSIGNLSVNEGDSGTSAADMAVTLSSASSNVITVRVRSAHSTTNANDVSLIDTIVTFQPGDTAEVATATVNGDTAAEATEYFTASLSEPVGTTINDGFGVTGITDDDPAGTFTALTPARILNTQKGIGRSGTTKVPAGGTVVLDVTGVGGVPTTGVQAVVLNLAVFQPVGGGYVRATADGVGSTSSLNYAKDEVVANLAVVPIGGDGNVRLYTSQTTHMVADVFGWFASDAAPTPGSHEFSVTPSRVLDTRYGTGVPGAAKTKLAAGTTRVLDVTGVGGVPATGASAVILNVAVTQPTRGSYLSVTPNGGTSTSNINFAAGETASGLVIVPVGSDGSIRYAVGSGETHVIADVLGWFSVPATRTGSVLTTVAPERLYDSRTDPLGALYPGEEVAVQVAGEAGIPLDGAASAIVNLTATKAQKAGYFAASADGGTGTANLNFAANQTVGNLAVVGLNQEFGDFLLLNGSQGRTHAIVDVFAWFTTPAP